MRAGSAGDDAVLLLRGRVRLVAYGVDRREVVLALRGPGDLIGEMAALGVGRRTATGVALDEVEVGFLSAQKRLNFLREHPDTGLVVIQPLGHAPSLAYSSPRQTLLQEHKGHAEARLLRMGTAGLEPAVSRV